MSATSFPMIRRAATLVLIAATAGCGVPSLFNPALNEPPFVVPPERVDPPCAFTVDPVDLTVSC